MTDEEIIEKLHKETYSLTEHCREYPEQVALMEEAMEALKRHRVTVRALQAWKDYVTFDGKHEGEWTEADNAEIHRLKANAMELLNATLP